LKDKKKKGVKGWREKNYEIIVKKHYEVGGDGLRMKREEEKESEEEGWEAWEKKTFSCWNEGGKKWAYTLANGGGELEKSKQY